MKLLREENEMNKQTRPRENVLSMMVASDLFKRFERSDASDETSWVVVAVFFYHVCCYYCYHHCC